MTQSPLRSSAQLQMMQRAAGDADYAKQRGIAQDMAQSMLDAHESAGSPKLPDRIEGNVSTSSPKPFKYKLLGSR